MRRTQVRRSDESNCSNAAVGEFLQRHQTSYKPPGFRVVKKAKGGLERIAIFDKGKPGVIRGRKAKDPTEPKQGGWPGCRKECEGVWSMRRRLLCMRFTFNPEESVFLCPVYRHPGD
jgi:hypothetical protein